MSSPETSNGSAEKNIDTAELESISEKQREVLRSKLEQAEQDHNNKAQEFETADEARQTAAEHAVSSAEASITAEKSPAEKRTGRITRRHRDESFSRQMKDVQSELTGSERLFSKVIHNKAVETTSDAIGSTIARPNALLAGSVTAFITVTLVYVLAKHYGYPLSGFETIGSFVLGWIIGLIYDYIRVLVSGKN